MNPVVLKLEMEDSIKEAIQKFEEATGLTVESIGIGKRFNEKSPLNVYSSVELR
ncbi:MAG: hypothetical protein H8D67_16805 [Deltaproteobacteria bacterium]|nr:hypothetical protein [Deltaproteobacteria bacterium]